MPAPSVPPAPRQPVPPRLEPGYLALAHIKKQLKLRRRHRKPSIRVAALNITSFLDMSFCLLMFLILSAGFGLTSEGTLKAQMARSGGSGADAPPELAAELPSLPLRLTILAAPEDQFRVGLENSPEIITSPDQLTEVLTGLRASPTNPKGIYRDDNPIALVPQRGASWQAVVTTFNATLRARYKNVNFARAVDVEAPPAN